MPDRHTIIAGELSLMFIGLVLLWRLVLSPAARKPPPPAALPRWDAPATDFFLFVWFAIAGGALGSLGASSVLKIWPLESDAVFQLSTAAGQLGMLTGIALFQRFFHRQHEPFSPPGAPVFLSGLVTFLICLPLVALINVLWLGLIELCGLPAEKQDLIRLFLEAKAPLLLGVMIILACIGAPVTEELVFRRGLFRYARTRLPQWGALLLPACIFAAVHSNLASFAPLVALGVIFSLAYQRTGRIGTSMVAHAFFNLNSILLILGRVDA